MNSFRILILLILFSRLTSISDIDAAQADTLPRVVINEAQTSGGTGHTNDDFIELHNTTDAPIDLTGWQLRKKTKTDSTATGASLKSFSADAGMMIELPAGGYLLWANSNGAFKLSTDAQFISTSTLTDDNSIALFDADNTLVDAVTWGSGHTSPFSPSAAYPTNPPANTSIERNLASGILSSQAHPTPQNTATIRTEPLPTPVTTPPTDPAPPVILPAAETVPTDGAKTVRINEILPNPSDSEEFIELFNFGEKDIDLKHWVLHDASKTGKHIFKESAVIKAQSYLTLLRSAFSFALNNGSETVTLTDPQGAVIDTVAYAKTAKDASYGFSPSGWRWSDTVTPDAPNRFAAPPVVKISVPKRIYRNVPAVFIVKTDEKNAEDIRYLWNFGDDRTSRSADITHTYTKKGTYRVTLTISGSPEETVRTFTVKVKDIPKAKLSITGISPNPPGTDIGNEWISIRNDGKRKVDLKGFGIATGTRKGTLTNHPVQKSLLIPPGKEVLITRDLSAFTLPNEEGFIELRQTNKKAIDTLHYAKEDGIKENEIYRRSADNLWKWVQNDTDTITDASDKTDASVSEGSFEGTEENVSTRSEEDIAKTTHTITTSAIIDAIDTLPIDELSLLKTQIEAKLQMTLDAGTHPSGESSEASPPETEIPNSTDESDSSTMTASKNETSYHMQSTENNARYSEISWMSAPNIPLEKRAPLLSGNSSLLARESLEEYAPTNQNADLLRQLNRTARSLLWGR